MSPFDPKDQHRQDQHRQDQHRPDQIRDSARKPTRRNARALVIGAGMAGLTAAFRLRREGFSVRVLESDGRIGGPVQSVRKEGHLFEAGPNTVPSTAPHLARLIDDLGLRGTVELSRPVAGRRLVWRRGRLHALPEKPPHLLTCSALGPIAKLRLFIEPLIPKRRDGAPETLLEFAQRRLGRGATAAFFDPFITGVYAGRLDRLGVDALPKLAIWEREHGSLFRALLAAQRAKKKASSEGAAASSGPPPLVSFPGGLCELPTALEKALEGPTPGLGVLRNHQATEVESHGAGYRINAKSPEGLKTFTAEAVVVATPSDIAAGLLGSFLSPETSRRLENLHHPFVATISLGYHRKDIDHPLDAFGLLVASDSRLEADVLGVLFPSSIFEGRAPEDHVTLTVMVGGARDPGATALDDGELLARAESALSELIGLKGQPTAHHVARWPRAIPQYPPGHALDVQELRRQLGKRGGLAVAGNYLDGVGVEGAVASGDFAAAAILATLPDSTPAHGKATGP